MEKPKDKPFLEWMDELIDKRIGEMTPSELRNFNKQRKALMEKVESRVNTSPNAA